MYQLSVPFMLEQIDTYGTEMFINKLKELKANIVFLALDCYQMDREKQEKVFASLRKNVPIFQQAGFKVGVWVWTFMIRESNSFTHITGMSGKRSSAQVCPSDPDFCAFAYEYMQNIAKSNPDMIMFDDDYRYGNLSCGPGCACQNHRTYMAKVLGEPVPEGDLTELIFSGGKNKYRSALLEANGHYFKEFAKMIRAAVDSVNPNIRVSLCACMTTWDYDGVSAAELARILAGKTKPFLRLIGAPYWSDTRGIGKSRLQDVIELERMESAWCGDDIELFAEGDVFPRPRFTCAANVLEGFDMALRASGATQGIHKYTLDYYSDVEYENGYNRKHIQNQDIYKQIDSHFGNKTPVGIRIYEHMTKFENMDVPEYWSGKDSALDCFFSPAAKMLATQTIPSIYRGLGTVGIAFGENVKYLDDGALNNGLILDVSAAQILEKMGVDVGLEKIGETYKTTQEYFVDQKRYVNACGCPVPEIAVKNGAKVQSRFTDGQKEIIGSYAYENKAGQKFLVFSFDAYNIREHVIKQYARGAQIANWITSIGKMLPAYLYGNPDCYMLCKENEDGKAVWIGNFFADECMNTTVVLDRAYQEIAFINCSGKLNGNKVELDSVAPFASVGFEVK